MDSLLLKGEKSYVDLVTQRTASQTAEQADKLFRAAAESNRINISPFEKPLIRNNMANDIFLASTFLELRSNLKDDDQLQETINALGTGSSLVLENNLKDEKLAAYLRQMPTATGNALKNSYDKLKYMTDTHNTNESLVDNVVERYSNNLIINDNEINTNYRLFNITAKSTDLTEGTWGNLITDAIARELFSGGTFNSAVFEKQFKDQIREQKIDLMKLASLMKDVNWTTQAEVIKHLLEILRSGRAKQDNT